MNKRKLNFRVAIILLTVCAMGGCTYKTKMYSGPELTRKEIAILRGDPTIKVKLVDGIKKKYVPNIFTGPAVYGGFEIYLLPGRHTVRVGFGATEYAEYGKKMISYYSKEDIQLTFDVLPGRIYWIFSGATGMSTTGIFWKPHIADITNIADKCRSSCIQQQYEPIPFTSTTETNQGNKILKMFALEGTKDPQAVETMIAFLNDEDYKIQINAIRILGQIKDQRAVEPLIATLKDPNPIVRNNAARVLGQMGDQRAIDPLTIVASQDKDPRVRLTAETALKQLKDSLSVKDGETSAK